MELWDLYTADRLPAGRTMVRGEGVPEGLYHIVVHVCVFNRAGEMLIQQRQPFKEGWSNLWDVTVGGSAVAGETSPQAAERELAEELGLKMNLHAARPALTVNFPQGFDDIYLIDAEPRIGDLRFQYEEVQAAEWCGKDGILRRIREKTFIPYDPSLIEMLFVLHEHRSIHTAADWTQVRGNENSPRNDQERK